MIECLNGSWVHKRGNWSQLMVAIIKIKLKMLSCIAFFSEYCFLHLSPKVAREFNPHFVGNLFQATTHTNLCRNLQYDNYGFQRLFDIAHYPVSWQNDFYHKNLLFVSHIIPFIATVKSSCDAMFLFSILYALTVHLLKCKQYFTNLFIISASQKKFWGYGFICFLPIAFDTKPYLQFWY